MITTIRELLAAIPNDQQISRELIKNLAIVGLALDGAVIITGIKNGQFTSENTPLGRQMVVDEMITGWKSLISN